MSVTIQTTTGNVNGVGGQASLYVFFCPKAGDPKGTKQEFLNVAVQNRRLEGVKLNTAKIGARKNIMEQIGGVLYQSTYQIEEGVVLKLLAAGRTRAGRLAPRVNASMFIRIRNDGPLHKVKAKVGLTIPDATLPTADVVGRFDILTLDEARVQYGVEFPSYMEHTMDSSKVAALFDVEVLSGEMEGKAKVTFKEVSGKKIMVRRVKRDLDI